MSEPSTVEYRSATRSGGFAFHFVGLVTPNWNDFTETEFKNGKTFYLSRVGLWQFCVIDNGQETCGTNIVSGSLLAVQLFAVLTSIFYIILLVLVILYLGKGLTKYLLRAALVSFCTGVTCMISFLVWITQMGTIYQYDISYSFSLTVLSFCLDMVCLVLINIELRSVVGQDEEVTSVDRVDTEMSLV